MVNIEYKNCPTNEQIAQYKRVIEEYLSAQKLTLDIKMLARSYESRWSINENETITRHWFESFKISTPEVSDLEVHMLEPGIEFDLRWKERAWLEATHIQGELYMHLKRFPSSPPRDDDPYWKLWRKHPTHPS